MNSNINRTAKLRLLPVLAGVLVCLVLLCSCAGCDSCVQGCSVMQEWYYPEMTLTGADRSPMLVIGHSPSAEEVNVQLEGFYEPVIQLVDSVNEGREIFSLEHNLTLRDGCYYLASAIVCDAGGSMSLPEIYIPYFGETSLPEWQVPEISEDAETAAAWLELTVNGVECDPVLTDGEITVAGLCDMYVGYYRQVSGFEPDTSRFADTVEFDDLLKQSMVLGICSGDYLYGMDTTDEYDLCNAMYGLLSSMYYDVCGVGSAGFTRTQLLECIKLFAGLDFYTQDNWLRSANLLTRLCDERLEQYEGDTDEMTRMDAAQLLVEIYEMLYGKVTAEDFYYNYMEDTQDDFCIKANYLGILGDFPSAWSFSPDYVMGGAEMPDLVKCFLSACRSADTEMEDEFDYELRHVTLSDALKALSAVDISVRATGLCDEEPVEVINDRDYEWYYTQHGTGKYSAVNCMPTITMMATKWYDEATTVTVEEMRQRYLPDYREGWYTWQVAECLEENGVPNYLADLSEDKLAFIDDGGIILSQMTEAAIGESGHCFVIYGYWKRGDSIKYYVHDPDVYDGTDEYGRRPGYAMVLDGKYCDWIIDRIALSYVVAGGSGE